MNSGNGIGRITKDIELKPTKNGNYTNFTLAVDDGNGKEKTTQFINCVAFNKTAETLNSFVKKGNQLGIEGKIEVKFLEQKQITVFNILVNKIILLTNSPVQNNNDRFKHYNVEPKNNNKDEKIDNGSILGEV